MTIAHEINDIGACAKCTGLLKSLSAHRQNCSKAEEKYYIVSSCAKCKTIYVHQYDSHWSWMDEHEPELIEYNPAAQKEKTQCSDDTNGLGRTSSACETSGAGHANQAGEAGGADHTNQTDAADKTSADKTTPAAFQIPIYHDIITSYDDLSQILFKLKSVFSEAEIQTLIQKSKNEKYVRQYYHRAKKKYKYFEEIFGIKLNI